MSSIDKTNIARAATIQPLTNDSAAGAIGARYIKLRYRPRNIDKSQASQRIAFGGLFLFTLLLYIRPNEMFPEVLGTFPLSKIVACVAVLAYLASKLGSGERLTIMPLELKLLAVITFLGIAFAPLSAAPADSFDLLLEMFIKVIIIFVLMVNVITTRERLRSMMKLVVVCGAIFAVLAIKSYVIGDFTVIEKADVGVVGLRISGAVGGFFGNPNDLATSLDLLLPLAVALALTSKGLKRLFYLLCGAILIAGVIVTFSRGGFLGLLVMGAMLLWKAGRQKRVFASLACAVILGVFVLAMPSGYAGRISSIFNIAEDPTGSSQARRDLLDRATNVAVHHPVLGVGMGNFHIYSIHEQVAHNSYLEIAAELGVAGLVAYVLFILAPFRSLRRIERETEFQAIGSGVKEPNGNGGEIHYFAIAMQGALFAYIVCSFFGSIQYQWFLYYPVAYAIALRRIYGAEQAVSVVTGEHTAALEGEAARPRGVVWKSGRAWQHGRES